MAILAIPEGGLTLHYGDHGTKPAGSSKDKTQIIRLHLARTATDKLLGALQNEEKVKLRLGKKICIDYDRSTERLSATAESHPTELFRGSAKEDKQLYFSGTSSHIFELHQAQQATAPADAALATLQNSLKSSQEEKASNETSFITNKEDARRLASGKNDTRHRPSQSLGGRPQGFRKDLLHGITNSTPSSPFLGASSSPRFGPTSAPVTSASNDKDKVRSEAIKTPLIHLLAVRPATPKSIAQALRASKDDCDKLLDKVSKDCKDSMGKKELKEKIYRELDVWKFQYSSEDDRQCAIDKAVHAFDRMRIGKNDQLWQLLLPAKKRGKGIVLSKLNFDQPVPAIKTPKLNTEGSMLGVGGQSVTDNDTDNDRGRLKQKPKLSQPRSHSQNPVQQKRVSEKEAISKQHVKKEKKDNKPSALHGKFKSPAIIEDSDEDMEDVPLASIKHAASPARRKADNNGHPSVATKPSSHKSQISQSSSSDSSTTKWQPRDQSLSVKASNHVKHDSASSRLSPPPRTDILPNKPSALASSPPTNVNDPEISASSKSSKSSNSSTAPSSPPSSSDLRHAKQKSSCILPNGIATSIEASPKKRKAEPSEDTPSLKRQHLDGFAPTRKISEAESESASSPEKADQARQALNEKSRSFKTYYRKYKDMHAKVMAGDPNNETAMESLQKMHRRIAGLKQEIWDDWKRLVR